MLFEVGLKKTSEYQKKTINCNKTPFIPNAFLFFLLIGVTLYVYGIYILLTLLPSLTLYAYDVFQVFASKFVI